VEPRGETGIYGLIVKILDRIMTMKKGGEFFFPSNYGRIQQQQQQEHLLVVSLINVFGASLS
jgi:hypothetical protein